MKQPIFILSLIVSSFVRALACSCDGLPPMDVEFARSDAAFVGRVVLMSIESRIEDNHRYEVRVCRFKVSERFKGIEDERKEFVVVTHMSGTACGFPFELGEEYLVYANTYRGDMYTSVCRRTRALVQPKEAAEIVPIPTFDPSHKTVLDESGRLEAEELRALLVKKKVPDRQAQQQRP
jgi:hypothetical protein